MFKMFFKLHVANACANRNGRDLADISYKKRIERSSKHSFALS